MPAAASKVVSILRERDGCGLQAHLAPPEASPTAVSREALDRVSNQSCSGAIIPGADVPAPQGRGGIASLFGGCSCLEITPTSAWAFLPWVQRRADARATAE